MSSGGGGGGPLRVKDEEEAATMMSVRRRNHHFAHVRGVVPTIPSSSFFSPRGRRGGRTLLQFNNVGNIINTGYGVGTTVP